MTGHLLGAVFSDGFPLSPSGVDHGREIDGGAVTVGPPSTLSAAPKANHASLYSTGKWHAGVGRGQGRGGAFHLILFYSPYPFPPGLLPAILFVHRPRLTLILSPFTSLSSAN